MNIINKLTEWRLNMNFSAFRQKYRDSENTKTIFMTTTLLLLCLVILQQCKINNQHERIVLVPPQLTKKAEISWRSAGQNYLSDNALYLASQISSVVPKNVDYVVGALEGYYHPEIWASLKPQLLAVRDNPNYFGVNPINQFTPTGGVIYEPETDKIFVSGEFRSSAYGKQGHLDVLGVVDATYEMRLAIDGGLPKVLEWYTYTGSPLTQELKKTRPEEYERRLADRQVAYLPMVADSQIKRDSNQNTITMTIDQVNSDAYGQPENPANIQPNVPQQVLDPFAQAEQQANVATQQAMPQGAVQQPQMMTPQAVPQQPQQAVQPDQVASPAMPQQQAAPQAPAVVLPNGQSLNDDEPL